MEYIIVRTFETAPLERKFSDDRAIIVYPDLSSETIPLEKELADNVVPLMTIFNGISAKGFVLTSSTSFKHTYSINGMIGHEYIFSKP